MKVVLRECDDLKVVLQEMSVTGRKALAGNRDLGEEDLLMKKARWFDLFKRLHEDQQGVVTLETILIIGAIALPCLVFLLKYGWPVIRNMFQTQLQEMDDSVKNEFQ